MRDDMAWPCRVDGMACAVILLDVRAGQALRRRPLRLRAVAAGDVFGVPFAVFVLVEDFGILAAHLLLDGGDLGGAQRGLVGRKTLGKGAVELVGPSRRHVRTME